MAVASRHRSRHPRDQATDRLRFPSGKNLTLPYSSCQTPHGKPSVEEGFDQYYWTNHHHCYNPILGLLLGQSTGMVSGHQRNIVGTEAQAEQVYPAPTVQARERG